MARMRVPDRLSQAPVRALDPDGVVIFALGTAAFAIAAVVQSMTAGAAAWQLWTAVIGTGFGLVGLAVAYVRRLSRRGKPRPR